MSTRLENRLENLEREQGLGSEDWILEIVLFPSRSVKWLMKGKENSIEKSEFVKVVK